MLSQNQADNCRTALRIIIENICFPVASNQRLVVTERLAGRGAATHIACRIFKNSFTNDFIIAWWQPNKKYH